MTQIEGCSSVGRASVSKTECREFEPCHPCQNLLNTMFRRFYYVQLLYIAFMYNIHGNEKRMIVELLSERRFAYVISIGAFDAAGQGRATR